MAAGRRGVNRGRLGGAETKTRINSMRTGRARMGDAPIGIGEICQTACKPGSVPVSGRRPFIWDARCRTPRATYPDSGAKTRLRPKPRAVPTWSCSRWGLPCRPCCQRRGALLPHPFTLTRADWRNRSTGAVCFLWHFPWGRPRRALPGTVSPWSPDFPPSICMKSGHPAVWRAISMTIAVKNKGLGGRGRRRFGAQPNPAAGRLSPGGGPRRSAGWSRRRFRRQPMTA